MTFGRHVKTWMSWINTLSPIGTTPRNYPLDDRVAMAQALAIAAPEGPDGMVCQDDCDCGSLGKVGDRAAFRAGYDQAVGAMEGELRRVKSRIG